MNILVSGSSGLIGLRLTKYLVSRGHQVGRLVRPPRRPGPSDVRWNPESNWVDEPSLEGRDAVVHLAGESLDARWTSSRRDRIWDSRIQGTQLLFGALSRLELGPSVVACASAVGYYGDRGEEVLREDSPPGQGFLADLCREWEAAAQRAARRHVRVLSLRTGIVLAREGGALKRMLLPFKLGLGGRIGTGRQYWSWIAIDDLVRAIEHVLKDDNLDGPINLVSPQPVTNRQFTKALGRALRRPALGVLPAFAARLRFGQMAREMLLASARVQPRKLLESDFHFHYADVEAALRHALGRPMPAPENA